MSCYKKKNMGFEDWLTWVWLLALVLTSFWPIESYLFYLSEWGISFLICKIGIICPSGTVEIKRKIKT